MGAPYNNVAVAPQDVSAVLTGYAYETVPGKSIIAGAIKGPEDAESSASLNTSSSEPTTLRTL
jgi:hypothetical protein